MTGPVASTAALDALRRAAAVGPYFAVVTGARSDDPQWLPFDVLLHDPTTVAERVTFVRTTLAERTGLTVDAIDQRACASTHFLGLASRLVAPSLATAALTGTVVVPRGIRWQRCNGGPVPIAWDDTTGFDTTRSGTIGFDAPGFDTDDAAGLLREHVITPFVTPLVAAFGSVSPIVLWGNVASALAGAAAMIVRADTPTVLDPAAVVTAMLGEGPLAGAGRFDGPSRSFRRNSCCLFYRIPGGGTCGDCVLNP